MVAGGWMADGIAVNCSALQSSQQLSVHCEMIKAQCGKFKESLQQNRIPPAIFSSSARLLFLSSSSFFIVIHSSGVAFKLCSCK